MSDGSIYDSLDVPTVVNAAGTKTRIGGSRIREEAREAMTDAADSFVRLSDLQAAASARIADVTGAEAGYVTNGAAGGLLLSAAACIAGTDPAIMAQLPDTEGIPDEIIMPRTHRTAYDHALRTAGATIVDIGTNDPYLGTGSRSVEPWEYTAAVSEDTVAIAHVYKSYGSPPLEAVCELAHRHDLPVIVDAAAEVPPPDNLSWFTEQGADLVVFSGGKGIRGPQTTGILAGRNDLVESVAFQHLDMHAADEVWNPPKQLLDPESIDGVPRQGVGRPLKVGKEEIAGLLRALQCFIEEDHEERRAEWERRATRLAEALDEFEYVSTVIRDGQKSVAPEVCAHIDETAAPLSAVELVQALEDEDPRVFVGADSLADEQVNLNPMCLTDAEAEYVVERLVHYLRPETDP